MASEKEIHVNGYVKRDGTEVSEYYRSAPEGSGLFSNSSSGLFNNNSSFGENSLFGPVEDTKKTEQQTFQPYQKHRIFRKIPEIINIHRILYLTALSEITYNKIKHRKNL